MILRAAVSAALIAAAFGLALPRVASYRAVWASIDTMTWPYVLLVGTAAAASMVTYWITIRAVLRWIGLRQAAAVSLGSNAMASTLPAGGAVAVGFSWAMLSATAPKPRTAPPSAPNGIAGTRRTAGDPRHDRPGGLATTAPGWTGPVPKGG